MGHALGRYPGSRRSARTRLNLALGSSVSMVRRTGRALPRCLWQFMQRKTVSGSRVATLMQPSWRYDFWMHTPFPQLLHMIRYAVSPQREHF